MAYNVFNLNTPEFWSVMLRFAINLVFLFLIIRVIYFRYSKKEKFVFSFFLMGIMIFFIGSMMTTLILQMSVAFGLFAVFAILRFRTRNFTIKDMSYIFTIIGISVINSLNLSDFPLLGGIIINSIIVLSAYILEEFLVKYKSDTHTIIYDDLELLKPDKKQRLFKELSSRTGKEILRVKIRRIDYKKNVAVLDIYFRD